jgi:hypothetical protein
MEEKKKRKTRSKRKKKRETWAETQVIRSRNTWKLQLCLGKSEDKEERGQYQKIDSDIKISKLKRVYTFTP